VTVYQFAVAWIVGQAIVVVVGLVFLHFQGRK